MFRVDLFAAGSLVISGYAPCVDVRKTVTADLKQPYFDKTGALILVRPLRPESSVMKWRTGGSALAQSFGQLGCDVPDLDEPDRLVKAFEAIQTLVRGKLSLCASSSRPMFYVYMSRLQGGVSQYTCLWTRTPQFLILDNLFRFGFPGISSGSWSGLNYILIIKTIVEVLKFLNLRFCHSTIACF